MTRELLLKTAEQMPESFHLDELFERLDLVQSLDQAEQDIDAGNGIPNEEAIRQIYEHMNKLKNAKGHLEQTRD